jgi:hypothetical protein
MEFSDLRVQTTASGKLSLFITESVDYENFPVEAKKFLKLVGGTKVFGVDAPDIRMWVVLVKFRPYFLVFDDFPWGLSLDPMRGSSDKVIQNLFEQLNAKNI